jgi:hypothetical protein
MRAKLRPPERGLLVASCSVGFSLASDDCGLPARFQEKQKQREVAHSLVVDDDERALKLIRVL